MIWRKTFSVSFREELFEIRNKKKSDIFYKLYISFQLNLWNFLSFYKVLNSYLDKPNLKLKSYEAK